MGLFMASVFYLVDTLKTTSTALRVHLTANQSLLDYNLSSMTERT